MPYFKDEQEVYETIGRFFEDIAADHGGAGGCAATDTVLRCEYSNPAAAITLRMRDGQPPSVELGREGPEPEVTMTMEADVAHRFWLGRLNVTAALARGEIKATGQVAKVLGLLPLAKPLFPRYVAQLEAQGRGDLVEAAAEA